MSLSDAEKDRDAHVVCNLYWHRFASSQKSAPERNTVDDFLMQRDMYIVYHFFAVATFWEREGWNMLEQCPPEIQGDFDSHTRRQR